MICLVPNEYQTTVLQAIHVNSNQRAKVVAVEEILKDRYRVSEWQRRWEKARRIHKLSRKNPKMIQTCAKLTNWQSDSKGWLRTTLTISAANLAPPRLLGSIGFAKSSTSSWKEVDCRWLLPSLDLDLNLMHTSTLHGSCATPVAILPLHLNHVETSIDFV